MKKSLFLFVVLFLPLKGFAGFEIHNLGNSSKNLYHNGAKIAELRYSYRWTVSCTNGTTWGSNHQTFDDYNEAVSVASDQYRK